MNFKAFFILIIILLAALCGAAQEDYIIMEGAEQNYFVENHSGSDYSWRILTSFNPDTEADSNDFTFIPSANSNEIRVRWESAGLYYLEVTETDITGCTNRKVMVVTVWSDTTVVSAPIANDDYDTTEYQTSVIINLLANDEEQQELDPLSLQVLQDPANGFVDINGDGTVMYTPNNGFLGSDAFQYSICNYDEKCDNANVFVYVTAAGFFIPEAFTPNADNVNDYFEIIGIELFEQNSITIVNRWGRTVYKARGYGISTSPLFWNGKSNQGGDDSDLPSGSYFYVLDLGNGEKPIAGSVYIDR